MRWPDTQTTSASVSTAVIDAGKITIEMATYLGLPTTVATPGFVWTGLPPGNMNPSGGATASAIDFDGLGFVDGCKPVSVRTMSRAAGLSRPTSTSRRSSMSAPMSIPAAAASIFPLTWPRAMAARRQEPAVPGHSGSRWKTAPAWT
jgi:hypothetical protein